MCGRNAEIEETGTSSCIAIFIQRFELFSNFNKVDCSFTQLDTKEQVNILLYCYPPIKSNQDIIKFVINFIKSSGCFDKPLISFNQCFHVLLFFCLPICLLYVIILFGRK